MNRNLFYLLELSISAAVFIIAINLNFSWHNELNSLICQMEGHPISSHEIVENSPNNMDILRSKPSVGNGRRLQNLICSDVIMRNKKNSGDVMFSNEAVREFDMRIWLDFEQSYVDELEEILDVKDVGYHMDYVYNRDYEIVEIRVERK